MTDRRLTLDLLRLLAALSVAGFHFLFRMDVAITPDAPRFAGYGDVFFHAGVGLCVFFAISGYVITGSATGRPALRFLVDRAARLWPAFAVAATITAIAMLAFGPAAFQPTPASWLANLTTLAPAFGQPFMDGAYWSIVYELVFYGWIALLIATGQFERWLVPVMAVWLAVSLANEIDIQSMALRRLLLTDYAPWFAVGVLLRAAERDQDASSRWLLAVALGATAVSAHLNGLTHMAVYGIDANPLTIQLVNAAGMAVFIAAARLPVAERAGLPAGLCLGFGALTYPFYLLHQHIGYAAFLAVGDALPAFATLALLVAGLMLISRAINLWVEPAGGRLVRAVGLPVLDRLPARRAAAPARAG